VTTTPPWRWSTQAQPSLRHGLERASRLLSWAAMKKLLVPALMLCLAAGSSCTDTCQGGSNFSNVRFAAAPTSGSTQLALQFDPGTGNGAQLPASYYQAVSVRAPGGDAGTRVTSASSPDAGLLQLELSGALGAGVQTDLAFGDRKGVISCSHPGADDTYLLHVGVASADGGYTLTTSESVDVGPI
jgi:hypothetical protein